MTMPQVDDISPTGAAIQVVNNTSANTQRFAIACNTQCYLASQATVSATAGLLCGAGSTVELIVAAGGGVWAFGANATEVTAQQVG